MGQGIDLLRALIAAADMESGGISPLPGAVLLALALTYTALWAIRAALSPPRRRFAANSASGHVPLATAVRLRLDALYWAVGTVMLLLVAAGIADHCAHWPL